MAIVNGIHTTGNIESTLKVRDVSPSLAFLAPRYAQILFLSAGITPASPFQSAHGMPEQGAKSIRMNVRTVTNFKFEWYEKALKSTTTMVNNGGGYASGATSIVVDDASIFAANDLVDVISTGEILQVTAVNTGTNTLTVTRSWGTTAAASIADNAELLIIGNAFEETGAYTLQPHKTEDNKFNYIQDTRHAFAGSFVLERHELYTRAGGQRNYYRSNMLAVHQQYAEAAMIFGEKATGTGTGGSPKTSTGGLIEFLEGGAGDNVLAVDGALTKQTFYNWLEGLFTYGKGEKVIIGSPKVMNAISNFAADNSSAPASHFYVMNNAREFGLNIMTIMTKFGVVHLIMHGMMTGTVYGGYALAFEPQNLRLCRVAGGFFMNLREDIVQDGAHRWVDEYATYLGLEVQLAQTGGMLTGVTG